MNTDTDTDTTQPADLVRWKAHAPMTRHSQAFIGATFQDRGTYVVTPLEDVWHAQQLLEVIGHGGSTRRHFIHVRYCQTAEAARAACEDHNRQHLARLEAGRREFDALTRTITP